MGFRAGFQPCPGNAVSSSALLYPVAADFLGELGGQFAQACGGSTGLACTVTGLLVDSDNLVNVLVDVTRYRRLLFGRTGNLLVHVVDDVDSLGNAL